MAFGDVSSIYELYGQRAAFEAGIGTFGSNYADPYQQYLTRNYDDLDVLYNRRSNLASLQMSGDAPNLSGYGSMPQPFLGQYAQGFNTPRDVQSAARRQFATALNLGVDQRRDVGLDFGGGAIPTLLRQGSRGRMPSAAAEYIIRRLPLEQQRFQEESGVSGGGGGDFLNFLAAKYGLGTLLGVQSDLNVTI
jgi:hypothetical protein